VYSEQTVPKKKKHEKRFLHKAISVLLMLSRSALSETGQASDLISTVGLDPQFARARVLHASNGDVSGQLDASRGNLESSLGSTVDALRLQFGYFFVTIFFARILISLGPTSFHPETSNTAFDRGSTFLALQAGEGLEAGLVPANLATVHHIVLGEVVSVQETVRFVHAADDFGAAVRAGVPESGTFEGLADVVLVAVLNAANFVHFGSAVGGLFALVDEVALGHSLVQLHGLASVDASEGDDAHVGTFLDAGEERGAVIPLGSDVVFRTLEHARLVDHGQEPVLAQHALHAVLFGVEGGVDVNSSVSVFGQATFGNDLTISALVPVTTDIHLFAIVVATRALTISAALAVGENGAGQSRDQKRQKRCIDFHHFRKLVADSIEFEKNSFTLCT